MLKNLQPVVSAGVGLLAAMVMGGCTIPPAPMPPDYEAEARAAVAEQNRQARRPSALCAPQPGSPLGYRKKLLVLNFPLERPVDGADIPGLAGIWSTALQRRLDVTDRFLMRDGSGFLLDPGADPRTQIITLAREFDAQLVVAGRISNIRADEKVARPGVRKTLFAGDEGARMIESSVEVFDGTTGARLKQAAFSTRLQDGLLNPWRAPLPADFGESELGKALAEMVHRQAEVVEDEVACLPMQARIVRIQQHEIHIDAGFSSNLQPGDRLRIVQQPGGDGTERTHGDLVIKQVFPESALGYVDGGAPLDRYLNGFVRAW